MADNVYALLQQAWSVSKTSDANLYGVEVAIVTNVQDPEKAGRVKICFPRLPGKPESDWARVAQPSAGPGRGFYWLPEVNDEVLVAFERGQSNQPYVLGALWNGKDQPMKDAYTDENTTRMIQTRSGHQIVLNDKSGEEKMTFADGSGKRTLTFDVKEKKFLIEAKEGDVEIHSKKKLVLECEDLEIKTSKTGKITIGTTFDLKVADKASFKAGPKMELKADKVNLNPPSLSIEALVTAAEAAVAAAVAAAAAAAAAAAEQAAAGPGGPSAAGPGGGVVPTTDGVAGPTPAEAAAAAAQAGAAQKAGTKAPDGTAWTKAKEGKPGTAGSGSSTPAKVAPAEQPKPGPQTAAAGDLDVTVVDDKGAVVAAAEVTATPTGKAALPVMPADDKGRAGFSAVPAGEVKIVAHKAGFADAAVTATVAAGKKATASVTLKRSVETLLITTVDAGFAPGPESLQVTYNIAGLTGQTVKLQIFADNYPGGKLFERDLAAPELTDGSGKTLTWDGTIDNGPRKDRKATPLLAPFKVVLFKSSTLKSEGPFHIVYHSVVLDFGKHTPAGVLPDPAKEKEKWVQARLNELGYDAGPVNGTIGAISKGALKRFQRANYQAGTQTLLVEDGTANAATVEALKAAPARALWEKAKKPLTEDAKFYVYENFYSDRGENFVTTGNPEFNSFDRKKHAEDKLERAFIPLEVEVKLMGKGGGPVSAPDAVGPVTLAWEVTDAAEDASIIPVGDNGKARTYVERARKFGAAAGSVAAAARIDAGGDNAPNTFDGMRDADAAKYLKAFFPDDADSKLEPFAVRGYGTQTRGTKVFQQAFVNAWDDATKFPDRKGRAGAYFRFSTKGGDDAKVRVSLSFDGLPNKAALETAHASRAAGLAKDTGHWTVWRRSRLNAYCQQAPPTRASGTPNWATIRDRWAQAFIEMENKGKPEQTLGYPATVTSAIFKKAILAMPAPQKPASATDDAHINYVATQMYAGPALPAQLPVQTAAQYVSACQAAMKAWVTHPINAILGEIHDQVRKTMPEGFVIFDFRIHDPVSGQDWDPTANSNAGGFKATANPAARKQTSALAGYVRLDGAVTMCVDNPFNVNCYVMHECGHARFLYHFKTGGGGAGDPVQTAHHHDLDQERCIMSYGINPDGPNAWDYRFCGKCILRLRGWDVLKLPDQYTP